MVVSLGERGAVVAATVADGFDSLEVYVGSDVVDSTGNVIA
jgi:hypothetical protein